MLLGGIATVAAMAFALWMPAHAAVDQYCTQQVMDSGRTVYTVCYGTDQNGMGYRTATICNSGYCHTFGPSPWPP